MSKHGKNQGAVPKSTQVKKPGIIATINRFMNPNDRLSQEAPSEPVGGDELHGMFIGGLGAINRKPVESKKK